MASSIHSEPKNEFKAGVEELDRKSLDNDTNSNSSIEAFGIQPTKEEVEQKLTELAQKHDVNRRRLQLKVDACVVIPISILYLLAFLDRVNISNAQVYGMSKDLHMTRDTQYNTALVIFFVPYVVFEVPSNFILKLLKPHVWLSFCIICFGGISIGQGFVQNYGSLLVTRFFLGLMETAMFPGCFYLLSTWYRRDEAQKRYSFFFASTSLAGAFGGLIAYGMNSLDGKSGLEHWRWIFIVEGAITCFLGIVLFFVLPDFPEDAKFISDNERAYIKEKLSLDQGNSYHEGKLEWRRVAAVFKDVRLWLASLIYFGQIVGAYGYAYFATAIIKSFGYSPVKTQVYSIFPWVVACVSGVIIACFSDFFFHRYLFTLGTGLIAIAGFAILLGCEPTMIHARYGGCFLVALGLYSAMPLYICWTTMNFAGHYRKMVSTAFIVQFGNVGGIVSTFIFLQTDAPRYTRGVSTSVALCAFSLICAIVYLLYIMRENKLRKQGARDAAFETLSEKDQALAGDLDPRFIYQY